MFNTVRLARGAVIAAVYIALTVLLQPISYGPFQFRVAEALTVLPIILPEAIPGLYVGTLIANFYGGLGLIDILGGSTVTLLAALLTYRWRRNYYAYFPPVVLNGVLVGAYLSYLFQVPYLVTAGSVAASEAVIVFTLGRLLVKVLKKSGVPAMLREEEEMPDIK